MRLLFGIRGFCLRNPFWLYTFWGVNIFIQTQTCFHASKAAITQQNSRSFCLCHFIEIEFYSIFLFGLKSFLCNKLSWIFKYSSINFDWNVWMLHNRFVNNLVILLVARDWNNNSFLRILKAFYYDDTWYQAILDLHCNKYLSRVAWL